MTERQKSWIVYGSAAAVGLLLVGGLVVMFTLRRPVSAAPIDEPKKGFVFPESDAKSPGEKILQGADQAFETKYFPTALKFYKDFDLRYAGTEAYEARVPAVWDRMRASDAASPDKDRELPEYLKVRKELHEEWKRLTARPRAEAKEDLQKFAGKLPRDDGRRAIIDGWLEKK
jgi:hypothetical protein